MIIRTFALTKDYGKVRDKRDKVEVPVTITEAEVKELSLRRKRVRAYLNDRTVERIVYVPGRLVNVVVS